MSKSRVYLAVLAIVFTPVATKAQDFDPEAVSQVSKAIAEWKLMNDSEAEEPPVYVSSSLGGRVKRGLGEVEVIGGVRAFSQNQVDPIIWYSSDEYLRNVPIWRSRLPNPGAYYPAWNMILIDPPKISDPGFAKDYTLGGPDPDIVIAHELGHAKFGRHERFADNSAMWFDQIRRDRFAVEDRIARDLRQKDYDVTVYGSSYTRDRFAIEDSIARDLSQRGREVTVYKSYEKWRLDRSYQEFRLDRRRWSNLDKIMSLPGYDMVFTRAASDIKIQTRIGNQYGGIGKWNTRIGMDPYRTGIPMGRWDRSVQQYYNQIGVGSRFYVPSYARPRTSYSTYSTIGRRR